MIALVFAWLGIVLDIAGWVSLVGCMRGRMACARRVFGLFACGDAALTVAYDIDGDHLAACVVSVCGGLMAGFWLTAGRLPDRKPRGVSMLERVWCALFGHAWGRWSAWEPEGWHGCRHERVCRRCRDLEVERDGERSTVYWRGRENAR